MQSLSTLHLFIKKEGIEREHKTEIPAWMNSYLMVPKYVRCIAICSVLSGVGHKRVFASLKC